MTAGPTHEPLDPVRFLANRSSGKQGYAIAEALARSRRRHDAGLRSGRDRAARRRASCSRSRRRAKCWRPAKPSLPADVAVLTAAVADWRPDIAGQQQDQEEPMRHGRAADQADRESRHPGHHARGAKQRPRLVIGFAAETDDVVGHAHGQARAQRLRLDRRQRCQPGPTSWAATRTACISSPPTASKLAGA